MLLEPEKRYILQVVNLTGPVSSTQIGYIIIITDIIY